MLNEEKSQSKKRLSLHDKGVQLLVSSQGMCLMDSLSSRIARDLGNCGMVAKQSNFGSAQYSCEALLHQGNVIRENFLVIKVHVGRLADVKCPTKPLLVHDTYLLANAQQPRP